MTVYSQYDGQPSLVISSRSVNDPAAPAVTVTDARFVALVIVPLPEMLQLWVTVPPAGSTVD
ncbi:hypothetical protein MD537_20335, partial [Flavihumibacter sediminis]|nr:hypothetical protein [Flavihumibacter sediminis]